MKVVNFVPWDDKKLCCAAHTAVSALDAPSSFVKEASPAKKSRFSSLKTVGAEELEDSAEELDTAEELEDSAEELDTAEELEDSAEELDTAELLEATLELETEDEDCALLLEDLALELLTAGVRVRGIFDSQCLLMSSQSAWMSGSMKERFSKPSMEKRTSPLLEEVTFPPFLKNSM